MDTQMLIGSAFEDRPGPDGFVADEDRTRYLAAHLAAVAQARQAGADIRGYFVWSLLDNFEWAFGFSRLFGLIHVDYDTLTRTVKSSGHWLAEAITRNAIDAP